MPAVPPDEPHGDTIEFGDGLVGEHLVRKPALHDHTILEDEGLRKDRQNLLHVMRHVNEAGMSGILLN